MPPTNQRPWHRRRLLDPSDTTLRRIIDEATIELIPMKSLERAVTELRPRTTVSVTCSPAKSIDATLDECGRLLQLGHRPIPHISARMVTDLEHLARIRAQLITLRIREIFVVGGDANPPGYFFDAIEFLDAFLALDDDEGRGLRQVDHIGYTSYPDTHPFITNEQLHDALHTKQAMILATGRTAHVTTQMCFAVDQIREWLIRERTAGLLVPVTLGVPGVIDSAKLMTLGVRLGIGTSLRYLSKNKRALGRILTQRSYEPDQLLGPLANELDSLGIEGLHLYTFNQVEATESWRQRTLVR